MKMELKMCRECGQLFSAREDTDRCSKCEESENAVYARIEEAILVESYSNVAEIAEALNVHPVIVRRALKTLPTVGAQIENDKMCASCGERPEKHGFNFCTNCLVNIDAAFRDSRDMLTRQIEQRNRRPEARYRDTSVASALAEKRQRTGHHRFNPVSRNIKGGGS